MNMHPLLLAFLTLLAGAAIGWLLARQRTAGEAHAAGTEVARLTAVLDSERQATAQREQHLAHAAQQREEQLVHAHRQREEQLAQNEIRLREAFGALSAEALQRNNEAFVPARRDAPGHRLNRRRRHAGRSASRPSRAWSRRCEQTLDKVQQQLKAVELSREGSLRHADGAGQVMRQSSEHLRTETSQLVTALRAPQVRGRWGEMQLERAVEAAGMTEHIDYVTQASSTTEDGTLRPDMVVSLVGGKNVVVDSKVAFAGYLEAMEASDEATRATPAEGPCPAHARSHRQLAAKSYWERFTPSPEFVVLLRARRRLPRRRAPPGSVPARARVRADIVIATPSTLVALLRTVAYTWRQDALAANAAEVHQLGRDLYQRISTMGGHIDKLGRALGNCRGPLQPDRASLESRVLVTARKMTELKVVAPAEAMQSPQQITEFGPLHPGGRADGQPGGRPGQATRERGATHARRSDVGHRHITATGT